MPIVQKGRQERRPRQGGSELVNIMSSRADSSQGMLTFDDSPGIHVLTFSAIAFTMPDRFELMPFAWSQYQNLSQCSTESTWFSCPGPASRERERESIPLVRAVSRVTSRSTRSRTEQVYHVW